MSAFEWTTIILTAVSMVGATTSWWQAHASRQARSRAEASARDAARTLAALEDQATALAVIAEANRPPRITATHMRGQVWSLANTSDRALTIDGIDNADAWARVDLAGTHPCSLGPHETTTVSLTAAFGYSGQQHLSVRLTDGTTETVPLAPTS